MGAHRSVPDQFCHVTARRYVAPPPKSLDSRRAHGQHAPTVVPTPLDALDLLTLQRRWRPDLGAPASEAEEFRGVRIAWEHGSGRFRFLPGSQLPDGVLARVGEVLATTPAGSLPRDALVEAVRPTVEDGAAPRFEGLQVHVFGSFPLLPTPPRGMAIVTSTDAVASDALARPTSWEADEWEQLLAGALGPWAAVVEGDAVAALCHTPKPVLPIAAECGVWTDPVRRGRGLATVATAAWARLLAGQSRYLFYSHHWRNEASAGVARRLGLRHAGTEWMVSAEPWPEGDAWGQALLDHHRGRWTPKPELEVEDGGAGDAMHPEWFFRDADRWEAWERELLAEAVASPALDLGAGAGRASLWLQRQGVEVTAVDSSTSAVAVCRERGVVDARLGDLTDPPTDKPWRLVLLLCGNLGLGGSPAGTRRLLQRLAEVSAPGALLVGDTVDAGPPELGLRIRYQGMATPWWRQHNIPVRDVAALVDGTGWVLERHVQALPDHAVLLRRSP